MHTRERERVVHARAFILITGLRVGWGEEEVEMRDACVAYLEVVIIK